MDEFLAWAKITRQSLDSVINKMEEKIELDDEDYEFIEKAFIAYEQGDM
ncbi:MAG: hypothetical protein ACYSYU_11560 [Planctomycetota bacterium]